MADVTRIFTKEEIESILNAVVGKTLGEVDINRVFDKTIGKPKITGIAGDVIEQSVLGYPGDNLQEPDIVVAGVNGLIRKAVNFPKSKDHRVFVRGTSSDSSNKPLHLNDIDMYHQQI